MSNAWCDVLGIKVPTLEAVRDHPSANTYSLLLVALLERGEPMTLVEVAARFADAGIAPPERALLSLQRCKPGRAPVYRDGDRYGLDPHDDELDLWAFRLGLRPPKVSRPKPEPPKLEPIPRPETPLSVKELDEAWKGANLQNWSAQRVTLAVLDAHREPMLPQQVIDFVAARTRWFRLPADTPSFTRKNAAVTILPDGRWAMIASPGQFLIDARNAVRDRIERLRFNPPPQRTSSEDIARILEEEERKRLAHAAELAKLRRVLLYAFPAKDPQALALLDVAGHELATFVGEQELAAARERLATFDVIGAMDVRGLLRGLGFDPGSRRLADLGPPQKSKQINKRGRTLKITTELLIQGSCGISRPLGDPKKLAAYLRDGDDKKLRRRLEANVKALHALYEYGCLHGAVRLRWGFLDELIPAPWAHPDEPKLRHLCKAALEAGLPLEVVVGSAPGWADPWARVRLAHAHKAATGWRIWLTDDLGFEINEADVQRARLRTPSHQH
ncbi:DNA repair protein RecN [Paraliomyxa miuraensis]|uniref:hypothetical protein n=1 Tax=Paraliomyxa miuraensis TaxID=376150 RepID=UPI0022598681|nr:hypothetical protein [Paraliomyxa miuraensis]MCX4243681.1 hypothetical protein [Paraliomyxa miuraensis]